MPRIGSSLVSPIAWSYRPLGESVAQPITGVPRRQSVAWWMADCETTSDSTRITEDLGTVEEKMARLRAVLFLAKEPLSSRKLSQYANLADGTEARTLVARLNRQFDETGRAMRAESVAGGYQLVTRPQFARWLRRLEHVPGSVRLSAPAMETLSVVAYRQPVLRVEIEAVRGVGCGEMLTQLLNRDLVRISGRSEELGRPYLYSTTKRFLMIFGLRSLEELPRADLFSDTQSNEDEDLIASSSSELIESTEANNHEGTEEN